MSDLDIQKRNEEREKYYCESCGQENLKTYIELPDGTIVCSNKCKQDWKVLCEENRKGDD